MEPLSKAHSNLKPPISFHLSPELRAPSVLLVLEQYLTTWYYATLCSLKPLSSFRVSLEPPSFSFFILDL